MSLFHQDAPRDPLSQEEERLVCPCTAETERLARDSALRHPEEIGTDVCAEGDCGSRLGPGRCLVFLAECDHAAEPAHKNTTQWTQRTDMNTHNTARRLLELVQCALFRQICLSKNSAICFIDLFFHQIFDWLLHCFSNITHAVHLPRVVCVNASHC